MHDRLWASLTLSALALAGQAQADWTTSTVYSGTAGNDIPVGVAVRAFGLTGDVVFVVERRDGTNGPGTEHFLTLQRYVCPAGCALPGVYPPVQVPPADQVPPVGLGNDQYYNASLALRGSLRAALPPGGAWVATLDSAHILRRTGPTAQCGSTQLNLSEEELAFSGLAWTHREVEANSVGNCQDRQLSYTLESGSTLYSCWTLDPSAAGGDNEVWCSSRALSSAAWATPTLLADGADDQDHPWLAFDSANGLRYVVHRNRDASPDGVTLRVPELGTAGDMLPAPGGAPDDRDYPSIARAADNSYHAVWHAPKLIGGHIRYSRCPASADCTLAANWVAPVELRGGPGARHAEIAVAANGRLMVMWLEQDGNGRDRVHFKETCQGTAWPNGAGQVPRPAAGLAVDQSNFMGRPHLAIDDTHSLVHLGYVEFDSPGNPSDGDVFWSRKTLAACP